MAARKRTPNEPPPQPPPETQRRERAAVAVVGIGASAGGLEALQKFFQFVRTADEEQTLVAPDTPAPR